MNDNVTLRVNGREWNGWTSVRIGAGVERLARDFSVEITRQWPGDEGITTLQPRIKNGSKVEVLIGDELVITGWVEATPVRYDARSVSTGIAGRSLTADLIDCAAEPTQFNGRSGYQVDILFSLALFQETRPALSVDTSLYHSLISRWFQSVLCLMPFSQTRRILPRRFCL